MKPIIEVCKISKKYKYRLREPYYSLRDTIMNLVKKPLSGSGNDLPSLTKEEFWALKDVSFDVAEGEVIGIIGRNGAGKTTLLKILSRVTPPTVGSAILRGRVASLLEVGTGFHPELTGRENIYLNGTILGMKRKEISRKFDEIVEFAQVNKFLDTPVKHYSSGMHMRLAFSVAAHLDCEILLIDEVLSIGDASFQKKSLGKMKSISGSGRTILFVSHNMGMVRKICSKGILLKQGHATSMMKIDDLIRTYQQSKIKSSESLTIPQFGLIFSDFRINGHELIDEPEVFPNSIITIKSSYKSISKKSYDLCVSFAFRKKEDYTLLYYSHNHLENIRHKTGKAGRISLSFDLPHVSPGKYTLEIQIWLDGHLVADAYEIGDFTIVSAPAFASNQSFPNYPAHLLIPSNWSFK